MCTYSQLKKNEKKKYLNPPPLPPPKIAPLLSQNCTRLAEKISQNVLKVKA